jgi:hypothetical protein
LTFSINSLAIGQISFRYQSFNPYHSLQLLAGHFDATMSYLPDEVVVMIVSHLVPKDDYRNADLQSLGRLSQVCKQWHRVVEPYLYRHVRGGRKGRSGQLLKTIIHKPWLGRYVTSLDGSLSALTDFPGLEKMLPIIHPEQLSRRQMKKAMKTQFSSILLYLPNLQVLDVSKVKHTSDKNKEKVLRPWLFLINGKPQYQPRSLQFAHLKEINAAIHGVDCCDLYHCFRLPSIETLNFQGGDLRGLATVHLRLRPRHNGWTFKNRSIKHILFKGAIPPRPASGLIYMAQTCPDLESLTFIGDKKNGYGANLFRSIMQDFVVAITSPGFRRLELWDEKITKPDKWTSVRFDSVMVLFGWLSPAEYVRFDEDMIMYVWEDQQNNRKSLLLPKALKHFHVRSSSESSESWISSFDTILVDIGKHAEAGRLPNLRKLIAYLKIHDRCSLRALRAIETAFVATEVDVELR